MSGIQKFVDGRTEVLDILGDKTTICVLSSEYNDISKNILEFHQKLRQIDSKNVEMDKLKATSSVTPTIMSR